MFPEALRSRLSGIAALSDSQLASLEGHFNIMVRWNRSLNLTTVTGVEEAVERHYCESVFLASRLPAGPLRIADIGSGPGFPGFPIAVARPDCLVTLIESHQRKAVFLREAARGLKNVRVISKRAEEVTEAFDVVVSRAVSYHDLEVVLKVLAACADLLTGAEEPPDALGFEWEAGIPLPWGNQRFLRIGARR